MRNVYFALAIVAAYSVGLDIAHAQAIGGGGGGNNPFSGILQWLQGDVVTTLSTLGIIVLGISLLAMRFSLAQALTICAAVWIVLNPSAILNMIPHSG